MENTITITREEYDAMLIAKHTLDNIRTIALNDIGSCGYSWEASMMIDAFLGIDRKEKKAD